MPVRTATRILRELLDITDAFVQEFALIEHVLVVRVRPKNQVPRCSQCRRPRAGYDQLGQRFWRHLSLGRWLICLTYVPRRVSCPDCGVRVEDLPWAAPESRFTLAFEEMVAYLAQLTDKTHVTEIMTISWRTVGRIVERVTARRLDPGRLDGLRRLGIDEFSYRKRHRYITIVVDHDRRRVVWAAPGHSAEALEGFFKELGPERSSKIEEVTIDMSAAYKTALEQCVPQAKVIFDRFHVQRLATDAVDEVRRSLMRELDEGEERRAVKRSRFVLLKNPWNLRISEKAKLRTIERKNRGLYRAYLLKETLAAALDYRQPKRATEALTAWLAWASRSKLAPFLKASRTIRKHFDGILAYVKGRLTNGFAEGINNKLRMVTRRAFGFHSAEALIAMLFLTAGGITLDPPLPGFDPH
jgi:transposase